MSEKSFTLKDIRDFSENHWPQKTAEAWDRVGLTSGFDALEVHKIMFAVDAVRDTVDEALEWGADLLFTHHPLLLRGAFSVAEDTYKGSLIADLIRGNCALFSAHTNADKPIDGVSDVIARKLGLANVSPIVLEEDCETSGIGRVGTLNEPLELIDFVVKLNAVLPETAVGARVAGDPHRQIKNVTLLGGSGDSLLHHPKVVESDVYITSDLRHHPAQEALEQYRLTGGPALIDIAHWASESLWLETASETLKAAMPGIETKVSKINTDPWSMRVGY